MIEIVAAVVEDETGRVLLVRKRGTLAYMQPGGKKERGETNLDALIRELREELACELVASSVEAIGTWEAPAANEPDERVRAMLYRVRIAGEPVPTGEIDDALWVSPHAPGDITLAPLTREHVFALLARSSASKTAPSTLNV